jgi:hypothetical protein
MLRWTPRAAWLVALLAACSGGEAIEDTGTAAEGSFGLMSVTYEHDSSEGTGEGLLLTSRAQFVHYSSMDAERVGRLLALPLDPTRDLPATDTCRVFDLTLDVEQDDHFDQEEAGHVELLEAGQLRVETASGLVTLIPRHFPGLLPFISGVVYGEGDPAQVEELGTVAVSSDGGEAVGAFTARAGSPALPRLLQVGSLTPDQSLVVARGADLSLRWRASDTPDELTYLEVLYSKARRDLALRCRLRDDGQFEVPAPLIEEAAQATGGRLALELARMRQTAFSASGLDTGELRVTVRERAPLQVQ